MIASSQISLFSDSSRQSSTLDSSQLRIRQSLPAVEGGNGGRELHVSREAAYRYSSQEQLAFTRESRVSGDHGSAILSSAGLVEETTDLFLMGREALTVGRAALGDNAVSAPGSSLSVEAGRYLFYSESESRSFASNGTITLDDGQTIDFTLSLRQSQSRSYEYSELVQIQERPLTDPLVINFGASTARLTDTLFEFDLNSNGETGQFAALGSGSGYLVLDRNGNGKVDDGSELFGPQSGSGFSELAAYDDDGNRWVDANDEIFESLAVWVQSADGGQTLKSLSEVGVAALYVDGVEDRFTLNNSQGVPLGQIRSSGIYLASDGEVRTLEELDLAEQNSAPVPSLSERIPLSGGQPRGEQPGDGNGELVDARVEAMRSALEKLNEIREKQQAFIESSREQGEKKSPLDDYFRIIDRLRQQMLESGDEKKRAASRYLEFASL